MEREGGRVGIGMRGLQTDCDARKHEKKNHNVPSLLVLVRHCTKEEVGGGTCRKSVRNEKKRCTTVARARVTVP